MLKQIPKLPRGTIEFSASGQITAEDCATVLMKAFPNRHLATTARWLAD